MANFFMVWILLKVDGDVTTFTCTRQNGRPFSVIESYLVRLLTRRARVEWGKGKSAYPGKPRDGTDQRERRLRAIGLPLLEVPDLTHLIGNMREAEHRLAACLGECIEGGRLHFDSQNALGPRRGDCLRRLPVGRSVVQVAPRSTRSPIVASAPSTTGSSAGLASAYSDPAGK